MARKPHDVATARTPRATRLPGGANERIEQALRGVLHDPPWRGLGYHLVEHGKREGCGVPDISGWARERRIEHEDADVDAVEWRAAAQKRSPHRPHCPAPLPTQRNCRLMIHSRMRSVAKPRKPILNMAAI